MKNLIVYYSYGGNTEQVAKIIQSQIGGELCPIHTVKPYTGSYDEVVDQGQREVEKGYQPEIAYPVIDFSEYDNIIIGSPVWWYTIAPAVCSFIAKNDFSGKKVYPYITNAGWQGHALKDLSAGCKGAQVMDGLNVEFSDNLLRTPERKIIDWTHSIS